MKIRFVIVLASAAVFIVCGWLLCGGVFSDEELSSKTEWSIVQAIESQHTEQPRGKIEIFKMDEYSVVGIPVHDERKEVWIMLNPKNPPYYKQIPQGNYLLSEEDFKKILASDVVSSTVQNCLESHVAPNQ